MTKKELVRIIREVVKREVKSQVNEAINSRKILSKPSKNKMSIKEALLETNDMEYPTMKTFNASDARAGFAALQNGLENQPQKDIHGRPVSVENLQGGLDKALKRDYSELVKRFK